MNILVRAPVEGEAIGPAKTEPPVNVIVGRRVVMGGRWGGEQRYRRGGGGLHLVPVSLHFFASSIFSLVTVYVWATCGAGSEWVFLLPMF